MHKTELRSIQPASVFALVLSTVFILGLVCMLAGNLSLIPQFSVSTYIPGAVGQQLDKLAPVLRTIVDALLTGLAAGVLCMAATLVYNIFAGIMGGIKVEFKD